MSQPHITPEVPAIPQTVPEVQPTPQHPVPPFPNQPEVTPGKQDPGQSPLPTEVPPPNR